MSFLAGLGRITSYIVVVMGDGNGVTRINDREVAIRLLNGDGVVTRAYLPKTLTTSALAAPTPPPGGWPEGYTPPSFDPLLLNDDLLPVEGTILMARPRGNVPPMYSEWEIVASSLPAGKTRAVTTPTP